MTDTTSSIAVAPEVSSEMAPCEEPQRGFISRTYHGATSWISNNPGTTVLVGAGLGLGLYAYGKHKAKKHLAQKAASRLDDIEATL